MSKYDVGDKVKIEFNISFQSNGKEMFSTYFDEYIGKTMIVVDRMKSKLTGSYEYALSNNDGDYISWVYEEQLVKEA